METTVTTTTTVLRPPPSLRTPPRTVGFSPLEFVFVLIAVITIPALIYAFFFINCPPDSSPRRRRSFDDFDSRSEEINTDIASEVKYQEEIHVKEIGGECSVCLSVFANGEEIKQLNACKHSFHSFCIDMWFKTHSNCPICRAFIPVKRSHSTAIAIRTDYLRQSLPDTASLV